MARFMVATVSVYLDGFAHGFVQRVAAGEEYDHTLGLDWCVEQFGDGSDGRWTFDKGIVFIHDADDAFAFKMRWC